MTYSDVHALLLSELYEVFVDRIEDLRSPDNFRSCVCSTFCRCKDLPLVQHLSKQYETWNDQVIMTAFYLATICLGIDGEPSWDMITEMNLKLFVDIETTEVEAILRELSYSGKIEYTESGWRISKTELEILGNVLSGKGTRTYKKCLLN